MTITKITASLFFALLALSFLLWGASGVANYSASFVSFCLIATASFLGYKRVVSASKVEDERDTEDEEDEQKLSKMSLITKTYKGWLFPFRLISYAVFVLVFLYFANNNILNIFAFLTGIAVVPMSALIFTLFFRRDFD